MPLVDRAELCGMVVSPLSRVFLLALAPMGRAETSQPSLIPTHTTSLRALSATADGEASIGGRRGGNPGLLLVLALFKGPFG